MLRNSDTAKIEILRPLNHQESDSPIIKGGPFFENLLKNL